MLSSYSENFEEKKPIKIKDNKRQTNLEILRIFSMLLIVAHHYSVHGGFGELLNTVGVTFNKSLIEFLGYGGKLGVNLFILISSYFLIEAKFNLNKLKKLIITVTFYSVSIYFIFVIYDINLLNKKDIIRYSLPIFYNSWWFVTSYTLLYLFIDYINIFIKNLTRQKLEYLIVLLVLIQSILPSFFLMRMSQNIELTWFFLLYLIGSYIKLYLSEYNLNNFFIKNSLMLGIIIYLLSFLSGITFDYMGQFFSFFIGKYYYFAGLYSPTMLFCSVFLFIGFLRLNIQYNFILNYIGASTFIIYLIHDNNLIRNFLWIRLLKNYKYCLSEFLIIHSTISIIVVFVSCSIIGIFYNKYIENILVEKVNNFLENFNKITNFVLLKKIRKYLRK